MRSVERPLVPSAYYTWTRRSSGIPETLACTSSTSTDRKDPAACTLLPGKRLPYVRNGYQSVICGIRTSGITYGRSPAVRILARIPYTDSRFSFAGRHPVSRQQQSGDKEITEKIPDPFGPESRPCRKTAAHSYWRVTLTEDISITRIAIQ